MLFECRHHITEAIVELAANVGSLYRIHFAIDVNGDEFRTKLVRVGIPIGFTCKYILECFLARNIAGQITPIIPKCLGAIIVLRSAIIDVMMNLNPRHMGKLFAYSRSSQVPFDRLK
ncbi:hypothetical protein D3C86_1725920 [compost metagenome]